LQEPLDKASDRSDTARVCERAALLIDNLPSPNIDKPGIGVRVATEIPWQKLGFADASRKAFTTSGRCGVLLGLAIWLS
jgi:hypothetical protein